MELKGIKVYCSVVYSVIWFISVSYERENVLILMGNVVLCLYVLLDLRQMTRSGVGLR